MWPTRAQCSRSRPTLTPRAIVSSTSTLPLQLRAAGRSSFLNTRKTWLVSCHCRINNLDQRQWLFLLLHFNFPFFLFPSVCDLFVLLLPVCVFPPRREECVENVPSEHRRGAEDLPSGGRFRGRFHRTEKRLWDLLLLHLFPLSRYCTATHTVCK